ncbi:MAG: BBP7 family outer membrane beta-barrel protein [Planctomycetota bacterium]
MALKRTFMIGALLISFVVTGSVFGQDIPSSEFRRLPEGADNLPFASPGLFDYDAQIFAPLEFTNGKEKEPNTGFYFTLDKTYTSVTRAPKFQGQQLQLQQLGSEFSWGTRYEGGWFGENEAGWNLVYQNINSSSFVNGRDTLVENPMLVESKISTFEINRIFRQSLSRGGYFEPYLGLRYNGLSDESIEDTTSSVLADPDGDGTFTTFVLDNRFKQRASNSSVGLQAGSRYSVRRGRWRFTGDAAVATTYNQQRYFSTDIGEQIDGSIGIVETDRSDQSFVPVIDGQIELAYNVSRDLSVRLGVQGTFMWDGIVRVNTETTLLNGNSIQGIGPAFQPFDEDFTAAGFLFGVEWRR